MPLAADNSGKVSQTHYWTAFGVQVVAVVFLLVGGLYMMFTGSFLTGLLMLLLVVPIGIWFRVIQMRRCRAIGWPSALPWIFFSLSFAVNFLGSPVSAEGASGIGLPLIMGLIDFGFGIVIGCVPDKGRGEALDYLEVFGDGPDTAPPMGPRPATPRGFATPASPYGQSSPAMGASRSNAVPPVYEAKAHIDPESDKEARWDDAIARALARQDGGQEAKVASFQPQPGPPRPAVGGFGRKRV